MDRVNPLDWALLISIVLAGLIGWRLGLVCGLMSLAAVVAGGLLGFLLGTRLLPAELTQSGRTLGLMAAAVAGMLFAQVLVTDSAQRAHDAVSASRIGYLNRLGGTVLTVGMVIVLVWMMATALALTPSTQLASLMRGSAVLVGLDRATPADAGGLFHKLVVGTGLNAKRSVFTGLGLLPAPDAEVPSQDEVGEIQRSAARSSVVRVTGQANCGLFFSGSGAVIGPNLVVTNAHVVAGIASPLVFTGNDEGSALPSVPVFFDPVRDAAVLLVPGLDLPALRTGADPQDGEVLAVAGYPEGGPLVLSAAAVRATVTATGSNIYGEGLLTRPVVVLAGEVLPGDSGGPILSSTGQVEGLLFAAATGVDHHVGYSMTASELDQIIADATGRTPVDTGGCLPEE